MKRYSALILVPCMQNRVGALLSTFESDANEHGEEESGAPDLLNADALRLWILAYCQV